MIKSMSQPLSSPAHIPHLDGIRGIAVLIILLFHLDFSLVGGGFIGVDVFFVLSGYLITRIIFRDLDAGNFSFSSFYARRIRRIFPALFVMLFATSLVAIAFLGAKEFADFAKAFRYSSVQFSNFLFSREIDYFDVGQPKNPLLHTWSLAVEEQFYLFWPLLLFSAHKLLPRRITLFWLVLVLCIGSFISCLYFTKIDSMTAFYMLHTRAWELGIGAFIAIAALPRITQTKYADILAISGIALILFAAFFYTTESFPGFKAVVPCIGTALIIYSGLSCTGNVHKLLSCRPLVWTGLISYSLYLWHWPIIAFYKSYFGMELSLPIQITMITLSIALAAFSYKYIETPFRKGVFTSRKVIVMGLTVLVSFFGFSYVLKRQDEATWRIFSDMPSDVVSPHSHYKICAREGGAYNLTDCVIGPNKDRYEVMLVGDSHASHYAPAVLHWAEKRGLTVRLFMRVDCHAFAEYLDGKIRHGKIDQYCLDLPAAFHETLRENPHIGSIFIGLKLPRGDRNLEDGFMKLKQHERDVYFLGTVPVFREDPLRCQIKNGVLIARLFPRHEVDCLKLDHDYAQKLTGPSKEKMMAMLNQYGYPYFDPEPYMQSPFDKNGNFMYMDTDHLNRYGGIHLGPYLDAFTKEIKGK